MSCEIQSNLDIKRFLPHRAPMLLVDIITDISNNHVITTYTIPVNSIFLKDNILQETAIIENMAQTCSAIVGQKYFNDESLDVKVIGFISAIKKIEILKLPSCNQTIETKAELIARFEGDDYNICTMDVSTFLQTELIAKGTINLFLQKV